MALQRSSNGQYVIKTKAEAVRALEMMHRLQEEYNEIKKEHGLDDMEMDMTELKRAATQFCVSKGIETLEIPKAGKYARLIKAVAKKVWVGTAADIPEGALDVVPLRKLVSKEVWMQITTRIPDPQKIDEAVAEGVITAKKIAPAYVETFKAPYLGLYDSKDE